MATWLRQPTGESEGKEEGGDTAAVRWVAAGFVTTKEALEDPAFPVARNDPHPDYGSGDPRRCRSVRIDATGYRVTTVTADYAIPINGEFEEDPDLLNPLVYAWQTVNESVAIDRDIDGNPIISSARRAVSGINETKNAKRLTITRWESSYNPSIALGWENTVNADAFEGAAVQEVMITTIQPSSTYTQLSTLIPIDYSFLFKKATVNTGGGDKNLWGPFPHQTWVMDKDSVAFATVDGVSYPVQITTSDGMAVRDVLMDGRGRPKNADQYAHLHPLTGLIVLSPTWVDLGIAPGSTLVAAGDAVFLRWNTKPARSFSELGF